MESLNLEEVRNYVEQNISIFHNKRIERLDKLKLKTVLKKKNPYLFKAKHVLTASEIVSRILNKFTSSFIQDFCNPNGEINWQKLVQFNSESAFEPL